MDTHINTIRRPAALLLFLFLPLCLSQLHASPFHFIHYGIEDKLSSNTITCLLQDRDGFIWIGTEYGLNRFDGYRFKSFLHHPDDPSSIGSNYVYALLQDSHGTFWVGTDAGIFLYSRETERFAPFGRETEQGVSIDSQVTHIMEDRYGNVWIATLGQGLFSYNRQEGKLLRFTTADRLQSDHITCLFEDSAGRIWITSNQQGETVDYYFPYEHAIKSCPVGGGDGRLSFYAIAEDRDQNLWIGSWDNGLCRLDPKTGETRFFLQPGSPGGVTHIHSLMFYRPDILLVGSDDGMSYFNIRTHESELVTATEFKDGGLSNKFVYPIYRDREGGLWVGTYHGGVNYAAPVNGAITGFSHSRYRNSVGGNIVSCFCEDPDGNIWIGTDDGGISHFNPKTARFDNYRSGPQKNSLSYYNIHALCLDGDRLWIGTYSGGLNVLDLKTRQFRVYTTGDDEKTIDSNSIYALFKDSDGTVWCGTMTGINRYDRRADSFDRVKETRTTTVQIVEDSARRLWFATRGKGVYRYDKRTQEWAHFDGTRYCQVNGMDIDRSGRLWIGTDQGLFHFKDDREGFAYVPLQSAGPVVCSVSCIDSLLWLGTMNGLVAYHPERNGKRVFYKSDGLQSEQFCSKASLYTSDGHLYLGTINGFNIIKPNSLSHNGYVPPVKLTNLQLFDKDAAIGPGGVLPQSISVTDTLELHYDENVFSIEYAALSYCVPHKNQYKYKLEGFDREWNRVGNQRKATYMNLPAGEYTFRVAGSNNDHIWNEEGASLLLVIHPPLWLSPIAYLFYALSAAGLLLLIFRYLYRRTEKRHREKIRQIQIDTEKEMHIAKINFFTFVAHEIRTPVSLIIAPLETIMKQSDRLPAKIQEDLTIINRNSRHLLQLINQLLDFRKAEQGMFVTRFSRQDLYLLLKSVHDRFQPLIEQRGITFELSADQPYDMTAEVDGDAITKVVSNLLTNASKYAKSHICISYKADDASVTIQVTDDGCGISEKEQKQIFRPFYQVADHHKPGTGIGLSLVKLIVDAHHGSVDVESRVDEYTAFRVTLPKRQPEEAAARPAETAPSEPAASPAITDPARPEDETLPSMLIVEDNPDMRNFLCESFSVTNRVYSAGNGKEAMEELQKHPVDLILSDVMMPVMDGIALCKEVKSNLLYNHIPFVLLTAKTDDESKITGMHIGADAYVEKPFSIHLLQAQIENLQRSRKELCHKFSKMPFVPINSIAGNKADEKFLAKIKELVEKNFSDPDFNIDKLAEQLCISRSGLFAKIKNLAGMTPNELIQLVRLKKAAELLSAGNHRINEICYLVGFNNPSYFSRCFQKQFGVLPKDFINKPHNSN